MRRGRTEQRTGAVAGNKGREQGRGPRNGRRPARSCGEGRAERPGTCGTAAADADGAGYRARSPRGITGGMGRWSTRVPVTACAARADGRSRALSSYSRDSWDSRKRRRPGNTARRHSNGRRRGDSGAACGVRTCRKGHLLPGAAVNSGWSVRGCPAPRVPDSGEIPPRRIEDRVEIEGQGGLIPDMPHIPAPATAAGRGNRLSGKRPEQAGRTAARAPKLPGNSAQPQASPRIPKRLRRTPRNSASSENGCDVGHSGEIFGGSGEPWWARGA